MSAKRGLDVHVGFFTSGGRGEYEVVGNASGFNAADLEGWSFHLRWPDGTVRDTGLILEPAESGKPRLRSQLSPRFQIGRIVSAMLMLPDPTRALKSTPTSLPIAQAKKYSVTRIGFSPDTEFTGVTDMVTIYPSFITIENQGQKDSFGVANRWSRLATIYAKSGLLPEGQRSQVKAHQDFMASGDVVTGKLSKIVDDLSKDLASAHGYVAGHDPLPALEAALEIAPPTGPTLPPPDELGEEEPEVSARSAHEYRLAKIRGASGRKFSHDVREAYGHRCAFCGAKLGGVPGIQSGIDAAHMLAWSKHDLDVVSNGIALCKLHHWAFDAGIMMLVKDGADYYTRFTVLAQEFDEPSLDRLGTDGEQIPDAWLPSNPKHRPSENYLQLLYADLGVTFKDSL